MPLPLYLFEAAFVLTCCSAIGGFPNQCRTLAFQKNCFIWFNESPSKMMKNAFYFILKALFVYKIFKFLSSLFGHCEKTAWLERLG